MPHTGSITGPIKQKITEASMRRHLSIAAGLLALGAAAAAAQEPEVTLTVHHFIGPRAPTHAAFIEPWSRRI